MFLATAAVCAGEQGHFWEMQERLFAGAGTEEEVSSLGRELQLDLSEFVRCRYDSDSVVARIDEETRRGAEVGLREIPGFVLGRANASGLVDVELIIRGAIELSVFTEAIDEVIGRASVSG
jgi:predicted DsbA family dithiol-disulfide isomerase